MSRTISDIHDQIDFIAFQERGGFNTPEEKDIALHLGSMTLFDFYRPIYSTSIIAKEALAPFRAKYDFVTDSFGAFQTPGVQNQIHLLSMEVSVADSNAASAGYTSPRIWPVKFPNEDEFATSKNSQNNRPTATAPIADIVGVNSYEIIPAQVHTGIIRFLKEPEKPVYNYTQSGDAITYNPTGSVDLEWTEPYLNKVLFLALKYLGINLDNEKLVSYADQFVKENS